MSPIRSRAAIRFVIALFLAQTFVNAVAVPHPHLHKVTDARQVVSLPLVVRQEPAESEPQNVFDAIVDTLKSYNGWQVFTDFFRKLFGNPPEDDNTEPTPVVSAIQSLISDIASITEPVVIIPPGPTEVPEETTTDEGMMTILPIFPITTAIELFPTEEPSLPSELISELLPETTEVPVVVVPPFEANSTEVVIALPTGVLTVPLVTAPIVTGPVDVAPIATEAPFPIDNSTIAAPLPGTDVPVIVIIPTGISSPIEANVSASAVIDVTVSLTSTLGLTVTVEPTLIGTGVASVGTGLPVTFTELPLFLNATDIVPTVILATGTGDVVGTIVPTLAVEPISAPFANSTSDIATAVAPIGTIVIGTGVQIGTAVSSILPVETVVLGTGIVGTGIIPTGTGEATAVAPIGTDLPLFPNTTAVEIVIEPTFVLGTGTAPAVGTISAAPIASDTSGGIYANTTTTTITNIVTPSVVLGTGIDTAVAPAGTIVVIPGPDSTDVLFPNITITLNATADATLSVVLPVATDLPVETSDVLAPIAPIVTGFPVIPIETVTPVASIDIIPSDAPVVEFPGQPILPPLPPIEEPTAALPIIPIAPVVEPTTLPVIPVPVEAPTALPVIPIAPIVSVAPVVEPTPEILPIIPIPSVDASAAPTALPIVPIVPVVPDTAPTVIAPVPIVAPSVVASPLPIIPIIPAPVAPIPTAVPVAPILPTIPSVAAIIEPVLQPIRSIIPILPVRPTLPL